jgi:bacteriorhodopsin
MQQSQEHTISLSFDILSCVLFLFASAFYHHKALRCQKELDTETYDLENPQFVAQEKGIILNRISVLITCFSAFCNVVALSMMFELHLASRTLNIVRYIDWIVTCPMLQYQLAILGNASTNQKLWMTYNVLITNISGLLAALFDKALWKWIFFIVSSGHFSLMITDLGYLLKRYSNNTESLMHGSSKLRKLCWVTICTWVPFPVLWLVSQDGFDWAQWGNASEAMFNILSLVAKLTVDTLIAVSNLEHKVLEEGSQYSMSRRSSFAEEAPPQEQDTDKEEIRSLKSCITSPPVIRYQPAIPLNAPQTLTTMRRRNEEIPVTMWNIMMHPISTTRSVLRTFIL